MDATALPTGALATAAPPADDDLGLGQIIGAFRRRWLTFTAVVAGILVVTTAILLLLTPRYSAEVLVMIEEQPATQLISFESAVASLSGDPESVQSEVHVLASRALAARVVRALDLGSDPEFMADDELSPQQAEATVIDAFVDRVSIVPLEKSRIIAVRFSSEDPEKATRVTNAIADEYLKWRLETKFELTAKANTWLAERIAELRDAVGQTEAAVESTRAELGLLESNGLTLVAQELSELNTQLVVAAAARAEAQARLQQVERAARSPSTANTAIEVLESPLIQRLREQEVEVQRRVAELSSELGEQHPRMVQLRAEARDLQQRINGEIQKIVAGLRNQVSVQDARETALQERLAALKERMSEVNQNEIRLRALEREAEANRMLLSTLLTRQKETLSQEDQDFQQPDATVVSFADIPVEPSFPRFTVVLGLAFVGAIVVGALCVLVMELLDAGFRSGEQLEQVTGLPSIGMVPAIELPKEFASFPGFVIGRPRTAFSEAFRTLNWGIKLSSHENPPRITLITSAGMGEGKTTLACSYAARESVSGRKVILIDGDVRRPGVHAQFDRNLEPGLTDVLAGDVPLDQAIVQSEWSGLCILPAGTFSPHAPSLLDSDSMRALLANLKGRFDQVIIDSPPVLVGADAQILAGMADATVFLISWGRTRRPVVMLAVRQLRASGARLAGGVLTMVDVKKNASYGYGDSGTYTGPMSNYYVG